MKKCLVIPTYWGPMDGSEEVVYDHPTGFEDTGTLADTLKDLEKFEEILSGEIPVFIVAVSNKTDLWDKTEETLRRYVSPFSGKMDIRLFSKSWFDGIKGNSVGVSEVDFDDLLLPTGYSQVRNLSLLAGLEYKTDISIFIDDDELLPDTDFFKKAEYLMGEKACDNGIVEGKAGYYDQDRPNFRWYWQLKWWPKDRTFNEMFDGFMKSEYRLNSTMVALGGNMVMTRRMMSDVCFDPEIHRGEDMDYVFNARMLGYRFYFDNMLRILHTPPEKKTPMWKKGKEDILRFLYLRKKYRAHLESPLVQKVSIEEFAPYPSVFMQDDLEDRILEHMKMLGLKYLSDGDKEAYETCMENAALPFMDDGGTDKIIPKLMSRLKTWKKITGKYD